MTNLMSLSFIFGKSKNRRLEIITYLGILSDAVPKTSYMPLISIFSYIYLNLDINSAIYVMINLLIALLAFALAVNGAKFQKYVYRKICRTAVTDKHANK